MSIDNLFPVCRTIRHDTGEASIFARIGGEGPPLLLLHGFPQTHAMWHPIAAELMQRFTCVMPDLRGYGRSSCPPNRPGNAPYSKRAMAEDMLSLMRVLGHDSFAVAGHDRGGRVAYRMALDHPDAVSSLTVLDIVPTYTMWNEFSVAMAMKAYHWLFLAQPFPLPEMLIGKAAHEWLDYTIASWTKAKNLSAFASEAMDDYRALNGTKDHIHAFCNDYRAGQTFDLAADVKDHGAGHRIGCPTLALWGTNGFPSETSGPLATWRQWCSNVEGRGIDGGHFIVEENPSATLAALLPFLERTAR